MNKVLVIGRKSDSTQILIYELLKSYKSVIWVEERRDDKFKLFAKRISKYGLFMVISQLLFMVYKRVLFKRSRRRVSEILREYVEYQNSVPIAVFGNINAPDTLGYLESLSFDIVILSGTRILSEDFLKRINKPVVNIHAGITPRYRGVHGGYWALVNKDETHFGSTIHYVDKGIDTGNIISYCFPKVSSSDNFVTYPLLQQKSAAKSICKLIPRIVSNESFNICAVNGSKLWTHPTIFEYFINGVK